MMALIDKKFLAAAVITALSGMRLDAYALAVAVSAMVFKMGLEVFCEVAKPEGVMIDRAEKWPVPGDRAA